MKKVLVMFGVMAVAFGAMARPHHGRWHHHGGWHRSHHYHHHSGWGRGGRHFWPGFVGGVVGGLVYDVVTTPVYNETVVVQPTPVVTQPVVVQQPTTVVVQPSVPQSVWVEGRYVDQVQPNGSVVRVWQPGHYEQR